MPFFFLFSLFFNKQSLKDGIAVSTKERRPEDGRTHVRVSATTTATTTTGSYNSWRSWRRQQQQRPMLRKMQDKFGTHHQSRSHLQVVPTEGLQSL
jgi:hypothetical protein